MNYWYTLAVTNILLTGILVLQIAAMLLRRPADRRDRTAGNPTKFPPS